VYSPSHSGGGESYAHLVYIMQFTALKGCLSGGPELLNWLERLHYMITHILPSF